MIDVHVKDVSATNPVMVKLIDKSGAHVVLTVCISDLPPMSHEFSYFEGEFKGKVPDLKPGIYECSFTVQAYRYKALNGMYDAQIQIGGKTIGYAKGKVPKDPGFDAGTQNFKLEITK